MTTLENGNQTPDKGEAQGNKTIEETTKQNIVDGLGVEMSLKYTQQRIEKFAKMPYETVRDAEECQSEYHADTIKWFKYPVVIWENPCMYNLEVYLFSTNKADIYLSYITWEDETERVDFSQSPLWVKESELNPLWVHYIIEEWTYQEVYDLLVEHVNYLKMLETEENIESDNLFELQWLSFKKDGECHPTTYDIFKDGEKVARLYLRRGFVSCYLWTWNVDGEQIYDVNHRTETEEMIDDDMCSDTELETIASLINQRITIK